MTIPELFGRYDKAATARCVMCAGASGHTPIVGDGHPICYPCLLRAGDAAADPDRLGSATIALLDSAHGDVVDLAMDRAGHLRWVWTGAWPQTGEGVDAEPDRDRRPMTADEILRRIQGRGRPA